VKEGMEGAGAIFVKKHGNGKDMTLIPLTSKDATKMVLEHIRDVPRTIERHEMMLAKVKKEPKKKKQCLFLDSRRVEDDLVDDGKKSDCLYDLYEHNYDTLRDMARKRFLSLVGDIIVDEKFLSLVENITVEEKLVGVADSKQEATGGAGKCVWAMACIFFRNDTWYSHQFIPFVYLRWTRIRYWRERKLK